MLMKKRHSILARCLANENIRIIQGKFHTAHFNMSNRTLAMPTWEKMGDDLYQMLVGHEIGHALFTPAEGWEKCQKDYPNVPKSFFNVIEDIRIERMVLDKYPGMIGSFLRGYEEMLSTDIFGIASKDLSKLTIIDKINIKGKLRNLIDIKFTKREMEYLEQVSKNVTYDDVVKTSVAIYEEFYNNGGSNDSLLDILKDLDLDLPPVKPTKDSDADDTYNSEGARTDSDELPDLDKKCEAVTYETQEKKLKKTAMIPNGKLYLDDFREGEFEKIIISHETLAADRTTRNVAPNSTVIKRAKKVVNLMIKEFTMRKAADSLASVQVSTTGTLDVDKLHKYRYDEDLFKQLATVKAGQSHGVVMMIDYSFSMSSIMRDVKYQAGLLVMFCKQAGIPFTVYGFTDGGYYGYKPHLGKSDTSFISYKGVRVFELINSNLGRNMYNTALTYLMSPQLCHESVMESMGTTPLGETLLIANRIITKMQNELGLDKMTLVTLTDGQGAAISSTQSGADSTDHYTTHAIRIDDKIVETSSCGGMFFELVDYIRSRGVTTIGYHVVANLSSRASGWPSHIDMATKSGIIVGENYKGYDRHFVLDSGNLGPTGDFEFFNSKSKVISTQFKQYTDKRACGRVLARKVMEVVA